MFHIKDESILCYLLTLLVYSKIETQIINWKSKKYLWKKGKKKNEGRGKDFSEVLTNSGSHSIFPEVTTDKYSKLDVKERERERRWRKYPCYNEDGEILWLETWRKRERESIKGVNIVQGTAQSNVVFMWKVLTPCFWFFFFTSKLWSQEKLN